MCRGLRVGVDRESAGGRQLNRTPTGLFIGPTILQMTKIDARSSTRCDGFSVWEDISMKIQHSLALAMLAGIGIGAAVVQTLHAQARPPVYYIAEIEVTNQDAYTKEFVPLAQAAIKTSGGRFLAQGGKVTVFEGEPPKPRVVVQVWDSLEKIQTWRASAEFKASRQVGERYAKFRSYAVEGLPQ